MLHLAAVSDDEPVAPAPPKSELDRRDIQRKLIRNWSVVYHLIVDIHGRPLWDLARLSPKYDAQGRADGRRRPGEPKLVEFCGPDPREETLRAWFCRGGDGARGSNLFELAMYLGECDMKTATTALKELADRLVEVKK